MGSNWCDIVTKLPNYHIPLIQWSTKEFVDYFCLYWAQLLNQCCSLFFLNETKQKHKWKIGFECDSILQWRAYLPNNVASNRQQWTNHLYREKSNLILVDWASTVASCHIPGSCREENKLHIFFFILENIQRQYINSHW